VAAGLRAQVREWKPPIRLRERRQKLDLNLASGLSFVASTPGDDEICGVHELPDVPATPVADEVATPEPGVLLQPTPQVVSLPDVDHGAAVDPGCREYARIDRRVSPLEAQTVLSLRDELRAGGLQESSIGSIFVVLRSILGFARETDFTTTDPFRGIRRGALPSPAESSKVKRVLRVNEIWRLIESTRSGYRAVVTLLAWSGLRVSEAIALAGHRLR
jgi:hypothetical protein